MKKIMEKLRIEKPEHLNEFIDSIEDVKKKLGYITTEMDLRGEEAIYKNEYEKAKKFSIVSQMLYVKQQKLDYILGNSINDVRQKSMKVILVKIEAAKSQYLNDLIVAIRKVKEKLIYIREDIDNMATKSKDNREYQKAIDLCDIAILVCKKIDEIDDILSFDKIEQTKSDNISKLYEGEECNLFSDVTGKKPSSFTFIGKNYNVRYWKDILLQVCRILYKKNNMLFESFPKDTSMEGKRSKVYSFTKGDLRSPKKIEGTGVYVETNMSANHILKEIIKLLNKYGMDYNEFKIYIKAN